MSLIVDLGLWLMVKCYWWYCNHSMTNISYLITSTLKLPFVVWKWKWLSCNWLFASPRTIESMEFSRPEYWSGWPFHSPQDLPNLGIEPRSPTLQADSLPADPPGKLKNVGVGSLSLLQQIFPTQESNQSLLHCRQILYRLSYKRSHW